MQTHKSQRHTARKLKLELHPNLLKRMSGFENIIMDDPKQIFLFLRSSIYSE